MSYRINEFEDLFPTSQFFQIIDSKISNNAVPRTILFYGPSGTGKTSTARLLAAKILSIKGEELKSFLESGEDKIGRFIEVNVSNNSGIEFARKLEQDIKDTDSIMSDLYIVNLNEIGRITKDAQKSLLDIIEKVQENVYKNVYIFSTTSDISSLIPDFKRRFLEVPFNHLDYKTSERFIKNVIKNHNLIDPGPDGLTTIIHASHGSPGMIIKHLQAYQLTKTLPDIIKDEDINAKELIDAFIESRKQLQDGSYNLQPFMHKLELMYKIHPSWESIRQKICFYLVYRINHLSNTQTLTLNRLNNLHHLLKRLTAPLQDYNMGKLELIERFIDNILLKQEENK